MSLRNAVFGLWLEVRETQHGLQPRGIVMPEWERFWTELTKNGTDYTEAEALVVDDDNGNGMDDEKEAENEDLKI